MECVFNLVIENGFTVIKACNNHRLKVDGKLIEDSIEETLYTLAVSVQNDDMFIFLRCVNGKYLVMADNKLQGSKTPVDEIYIEKVL